ncbi:MAG: hypothetical protein IPL53_25260 [Ignavibacteria bacterium]|nr:hypothetical protein [Ignavibacteria bacterium]
MLKQTTSQNLSQKILPKIIMQQNILALPALALDNIIKRELELNPMLEEESEFEQEELEQVSDTIDTDKNDDDKI